MDHLDHVLAQWAAERPDLDVSPMGIVGRLSRAAAAVEIRLAATFALHGIDAGTFDVLATLVRQGAPHRASPGQLAAEAMITSSAVAQRLNRLEALGLVERLANPADGRGKLVQITAAGVDLVDRVLPDHLATEQALIVGLSEDDQRILARLLSRIERSAKDARDDEEQDRPT